MDCWLVGLVVLGMAVDTYTRKPWYRELHAFKTFANQKASRDKITMILGYKSQPATININTKVIYHELIMDDTPSKTTQVQSRAESDTSHDAGLVGPQA